MISNIDLHIHSRYSDDGDFTPEDLVHQCKEAGIKAMSITDHNSARANAEAKKEAHKQNIDYITGIEIDSTYQELELHLIGYDIDENSPDFIKLDDDLHAKERIASRERLTLTKQLGFNITAEELNAVKNIDDSTGVWTGELFATILLAKKEHMDHPLLLPYRENGERSDNPYVNFYWDIYAQGKPCYVKVEFPKLEEAIAMIKNNGGKAVLAHPGNNLKGRFELFEEIVKKGIDGVEVFCSYHNKKDAEYFYKKAQQHSLIITFGSDYHGRSKPSVKLGNTGCWLDQKTMDHQLTLLQK